jgi:CheY-like chemotaxis protein
MVILCAEDNVWALLIIRTLLQADGFTVLTAANAEAALEASRNYHGPVDLLLASTEMPGMSSLELCRNIKLDRPGIKVLMMSGDLQGRDRASTIGFPFVQEPFNATALRDSIEALLGPIPHGKPIPGPVRSGVTRDIDILKVAMIACRTQIVELLSILERAVKAPGNEPIAPAPRRKTAALRKGIVPAKAAGAAKKSKAA